MENETVIKIQCIEYVETISPYKFIIQRLSVSSTVTLTFLLTNVLDILRDPDL
jgi:hypothetical protein